MQPSPYPVRPWQIAIAFAGLVFLGFCALAYGQVGWRGFDQVLAQPWGLVTLLDVMLGAACMSAVIMAHERNTRTALMWALPIFVLGHVVSVAWVVVRFLPSKR